jgi:hypothetical protein
MKKSIVLITIALFSETMIAQADTAAAPAALRNTDTSDHAVIYNNRAVTPPKAVSDAFITRFPDARIKKWMERKEGFIAVFRLNRQKDFAYYSADGTWKATETPLKWTWHLPDVVRHSLRHGDFAAWYVMEIKKLVTPEQTLYVLRVNNSPLLDSDHAQIDSEEYNIFFTEDGRLVRKDMR